MARIVRAALAAAASLAALVGGATTAHAAETKPYVQLETATNSLCLGAAPDNTTYLDKCNTDWMFPAVWDAVPTAGSTFELRWAGGNGNCLAVQNGGTQAGAGIHVAPCNGAKQTRWQLDLIDPVGKLYQLRPTHVADRCLDIPNGDITHLKPVQQWTCNQTTAQKWRVKKIQW